VLERFTERARKVVILAQDEARHFNHSYVGTEHLLLGLLAEEQGIAAKALLSLGVTLPEVREQVESIVGYGEEDLPAQAPFTPRTKKVLELAMREALQLGHNNVGTEHLLLGLIRETEGVAARVLSNLEVDPDKVRREVIRRLGGARSRSRGGSKVGSTDKTGGELVNKHLIPLRGGADGPAGLLLAVNPQSISHVTSRWDKREQMNMLVLHLANGRPVGVYETHANAVLEALGLEEFTNDWVLSLEKDLG